MCTEWYIYTYHSVLFTKIDSKTKQYFDAAEDFRILTLANMQASSMSTT